MNSKNIIIVGCYITTDDNKKVLINYINQLKKTGNDILLVSHSPIDDQDILNLVSYYIYDYDNFLLPKEKVPVTWFADDFEYINLYSCVHMYAITKNIYTSLNFCNLNDYKYFIYTEYDYILDDQDISKISDVFDQLEKNDKKLFFGNPHNYTHYQTQFFAGEINFFIKNIPLVKTYDEWCTIYPYSLGNLPLEQSIALAAKDFIDKTIFVSSIADYFSNSDTDVYSIYDHRYPIIYNLENKYLPLLFFISKGGNYLIKIDEKIILNRYCPKGERINIKFCLKNTPVNVKVFYNENVVIDKIVTLDNIEDFRNFAERGLIDVEKYSYKNTVPIVLLCHNNELYVDNTIKQLKKYHNNFIILDNGSDDVDTINYLNNIEKLYKVIRLNENNQPFVAVTKIYDQMPDYFCFTDPDLEFNENLPTNFIENLIEISHKQNVNKVGFALKISDADLMYQTTDYYQNNNIYDWEKQFWKKKVFDEKYELYYANIDTTFALYNKNIDVVTFDNFFCDNKIRIAGNFTCRHLPWYPYHNNLLGKDKLEKIYKNSPHSTSSKIIKSNSMLPNKYCVIFASHIPSEDYLFVGEEILNMIFSNLPNVDLFVGINPSPCLDKWVEIVKKYTNHYEITPDNLVINSDASAYQSALRLYKKYIKDYDLIWFVHTQGTSSGRHDIRKDHLKTLFEEKDFVFDIFKNEEIGAYGNQLTSLPWCLEKESNFDFYDFYLKRFGVEYINTPIRCFLTGTMFVFRGKILNNFLINCNDNFYNEILHTPHTNLQGDKWFFERDFIHIVDAFNDYILKGKCVKNVELYNIDTQGKTDEEFYYDLLNEWKEKNKFRKK